MTIRVSEDDQLRRAASLMRRRALAATQDYWSAPELRGMAPMLDRSDRSYIASMHPGVGLAVAELLDTLATYCSQGDELLPLYAEAYAIALTYLQE